MKLTTMMAITADGIIGRDRDHFPNWTCGADKRMFKKVTQDAGVVIMGSRTFDTIGKPLPGRLNVVLTRRPERYRQLENLWICSDPVDKLMADLSRQGYELAILAGGAIVNTLFLRAGLIDELLLTVAPKLFGQGLTLLSEAVDIDLELLDIQRLDGDSLVIRYRLKYPSPEKTL